MSNSTHSPQLRYYITSSLWPVILSNGRMPKGLFGGEGEDGRFPWEILWSSSNLKDERHHISTETVHWVTSLFGLSFAETKIRSETEDQRKVKWIFSFGLSDR